MFEKDVFIWCGILIGTRQVGEPCRSTQSELYYLNRRYPIKPAVAMTTPIQVRDWNLRVTYTGSSTQGPITEMG